MAWIPGAAWKTQREGLSRGVCPPWAGTGCGGRERRKGGGNSEENASVNKRIGSCIDCAFDMEESVASMDFTMFFSCYRLSPIAGTLSVAINGSQERDLRFTLDWETGRWVFKSVTPQIEEWRGCTK